MKKEIIVSSIIMIVALAVASVLAPVLQGKHQQINPDREKLSAAPVGGMHKVVADWEWMAFINYLGNLQSVDETNVKEVTARLERLMRLDPKFERLYLDGLAFIQHADPKKAVDILDSACRLDYLRDNWKIPFFTGFIYSRNTYDPKDQNGPPLMSADHAKAAEYFRMALERAGSSPENHLVNSYVREVAKSEATGSSPDREHLAKLRFLFREWNQSQKAPETSGTGSLIPDLKVRLRSALQDAIHPHDVYGRDYEPSAELRKLAEEIRLAVFAEENLCHKCFRQSKPGNFCSHCGEKLSKPAPSCPKCSTVLDKNANFCPKCGESVRTAAPSVEQTAKKQAAPAAPTAGQTAKKATPAAPAAPAAPTAGQTAKQAAPAAPATQAAEQKVEKK